MKSRNTVIIAVIVVVVLILIMAFVIFSRGRANETNTQTNITPSPAITIEGSPTTISVNSTPPGPTVEATATATVTPLPPLTAQVLDNMNVRSGPGTEYERVGGVNTGSEVTILGRSEDGLWYVIEFEGGTAWIFGDPAYIDVDPTLASSLTVFRETGETAFSFNINNEDVNNLLNKIPLVIHHEATFTCASHAGLNNLEGVQEGNVIGPHSGDFVHTELGNVLFKYEGGDLRLIRENPIARFAGDAESLPLDQALQMFERREIIWNGQFGDSPARGVAGCDLSAPS